MKRWYSIHYEYKSGGSTYCVDTGEFAEDILEAEYQLKRGLKHRGIDRAFNVSITADMEERITLEFKEQAHD